ncbi:MAG: class I SAM-dependent methyltransferase [Jiangellaceae bacterium]
MPEPLLPALDRLRTDLLDADRLVRAVAAGRRRDRRPAFRRVELRWVDLREGRRLQVVSYDDRQAFTVNHAADAAAAAVDALLAEPYGNWHVETTDATVQLRVTKKSAAQVHRSAGRAPGPVGRGHDRAKERLLDPSDPFLYAVGISDAQGRIKPTRRDKYRQVEEFLRASEPVLDAARSAAGGGPLLVVDLGCGNAYLTFAAYRWLTGLGLDVRLTGVDVKSQARERNTALAASLGWGDGLRFVEGTIDGVEIDDPPHVVLALHACDTATDDALARAVRWRAPVVLAAPCCHHDVQRQLRGVAAPEPYGPLTRHGILRERFADVLTDAVRASLLRILGYRVEVVEFVESAHTPRNTLLRAVRTGAAPDLLTAEYVELVSAWKLHPALHERLSDDVEAAMGSASTRSTGSR